MLLPTCRSLRTTRGRPVRVLQRDREGAGEDLANTTLAIFGEGRTSGSLEQTSLGQGAPLSTSPCSVPREPAPLSAFLDHGTKAELALHWEKEDPAALEVFEREQSCGFGERCTLLPERAREYTSC